MITPADPSSPVTSLNSINNASKQIRGAPWNKVCDSDVLRRFRLMISISFYANSEAFLDSGTSRNCGELRHGCTHCDSPSVAAVCGPTCRRRA